MAAARAHAVHEEARLVERIANREVGDVVLDADVADDALHLREAPAHRARRLRRHRQRQRQRHRQPVDARGAK